MEALTVRPEAHHIPGSLRAWPFDSMFSHNFVARTGSTHRHYLNHQFIKACLHDLLVASARQ